MNNEIVSSRPISAGEHLRIIVAASQYAGAVNGGQSIFPATHYHYSGQPTLDDMLGLASCFEQTKHACGNVAEVITGSGNGQEWFYCSPCRVEFHVSSIKLTTGEGE